MPGNLPLGITNRAKNKDGSISTVRTLSIGVDGGEVLIPTVINNRVVSDDEAIRYYEKTGKNFGVFRTPNEATAYAEALHNYHAQLLEQERQPSLGMRHMSVADVLPHLIKQESGGRAGVAGPVTPYGQAQGLTQVLPDTAKGIAKRLGVPYRPDLMSGTSSAAADYQRAIGQAYLEEGLAKTGTVEGALKYYHGGPNRRLWGRKTNQYASDVLRRMGV